MKKIIFLVLLVVAIAAGLKFCNREQPLPEVQTEVVQRRSLRSVVSGSGQIRPKVSVDVSSDVMGRVLEVPVKEGDPVQRGQVLLKIDSSQVDARMAGMRAASESARASLEQARTNRERTKRAYDRQADMYKQKLVSDSAYEDSMSARDNAIGAESVARGALAQAEATLREAENNLGKYTIVAPMSGILTRKNIEPGEMAVTGTLSVAGTLLMTISDLSVMEVEVEVDEVDIVHVRMAQKVTVEVDAFPDRKWPGEVTEVGTSALEKVGEQAKLFRVVITLSETSDELKPGLSASADIVTATREGALAVPIQALTIRSSNEMQGAKDGLPLDVETPLPGAEKTPRPGTVSAASGPEAPAPEKPEAGAPEASATVTAEKPAADAREMEGVFLLEGDQARFREVKLGITGELHFELLGGLEGGEAVVIGPYETLRKLKDGEKIREKGKQPDGKDAPKDRG